MRSYGLNGRSHFRLRHAANSLFGVRFLDRGRDFDVYGKNSYTRLFGQPRRRAEDVLVASSSVVLRWRRLHLAINLDIAHVTRSVPNALPIPGQIFYPYADVTVWRFCHAVR